MALDSRTSPGVAFARIFWMILGPLVLVLLTFWIVNSGTGWWTGADLAFFVILGAMMVARWLEFAGGQPQTATGEPATAWDLRAYVVGALLLGGALWVLANLLGNHILTL